MNKNSRLRERLQKGQRAAGSRVCTLARGTRDAALTRDGHPTAVASPPPLQKHFLSVPLCICSRSVVVGGVSFPGTWLEDLPRRGSTFPGTETPGTARALSSGPRPLGKADAAAPSSPWARCSPPGAGTCPEFGSLFFIPWPLSFRDPWGPGLRASSCILTQLLVGALRSRVPKLGLGGASPALQPGPPSLSCRFSLPAGRRVSRRPWRCPSGPATLQTWAGLRFAAHSLPPSLARCRAVTWEAQLSTSGSACGVYGRGAVAWPAPAAPAAPAAPFFSQPRRRLGSRCGHW
nr:uncharacterized protein LOC108400999 [Manis javanica]